MKDLTPMSGNFTATGATQAFDLTGVGQGTANTSTRVQFSGFTVRAVPEPTSLLLLGLGMLGFLRRKRI